MDKKKVLVTGVAGFLGSHLADHLITKGLEVVGVDNMIGGDLENVNPKVKFTKLDLNNVCVLINCLIKSIIS